ncbi:MAG: YidH family protein [Solirubrobacteraceae bacterium]
MPASIGSVVERRPEPADPDTTLNVEMAAERTWLAWWRTALVAMAGALGVGRLAPRLLHAAPAPYVVLGCCYALLAFGLLVVGLVRHRAIERAVERGERAPLAARTVELFTLGGLILATVTTVVVLAQS